MPVTLSNIPEISNISLEEALRALLDYGNAKGLSDQVLELNLLLGDYLRTRDSLTLTSDQKNARTAGIHQSLLQMVNKLEEAEQAPTNTANPNEVLSIDPEIHKNTCNRDQQLHTFKQLNESLNGNNPIQFYYVIGEESDLVPGFVKRVAFDLRGNVLGRLGSSNDSVVKVESDEVDFRLIGGDERSSMIELKKGIFDRFGIDTTNREIAPLSEKNFQYIIDHSPFFKDKSRHRIMITHILVHELEWDEDLVPEILESFFNDFFDAVETDTTLEFLFFVGFEYDEEDGDEIREIIKAQSLAIEGLEKIPALEKISYKDIRRWFNHYRFMFEDSSSRKSKLENLFKDKNGVYDMEDVQRKLKSLIIEYNNAQLYG